LEEVNQTKQQPKQCHLHSWVAQKMRIAFIPTQPWVCSPKERPLCPWAAKKVGIRFQVAGTIKAGHSRFLFVPMKHGFSSAAAAAEEEDSPLHPSVAKSTGIVSVGQMPVCSSMAKSMGMSFLEKETKANQVINCALC
jgi:hypothetical protein